MSSTKQVLKYEAFPLIICLEFKECNISDTLHRFWKKEHDWGWKKFMELSKLLDGFVVDDVLTIKAQVQVIRYLFLWIYTFNFSFVA
jgi:hypothetical protein